ncbi:putative membrane protein YphA (DoxX/SURF4 family) [Spinactinospora alkalitolerans]|uniref:Putative membrane protein YphA (DoxX/SURF4 family) n=1 Tax=Spinactinospora alkalitolerans TaxID=687207 RepID=A0A852U071_9ACTN|nr:DoxX family protein [Spinactinospora alkalitolerans]NYE48413.1 putative membrane protein YphA (DoxX/SURF4 family) [Spinactinospora alkalitolerans]
MTDASSTGGTAAPGRRANIALWALQIPTALFFALASALPKLIAHPSAVEGFEAMGTGAWFMYLIGVLELAGAVALLIPILSGLSALAFIGLMIGAFITQVVMFDGQNAATPIIIMVVMAVIAWGRRGRTAQLAERVSAVLRAPGHRARSA